MYPISTSDSHFSFNGSSLLLPPVSDILLSPTNNHVEDPLALPPLQITGLGLLSSQQQLFTLYVCQNSTNHVNDSQVTHLQDHCNTLEHHLVKVTSECDTIKNLFDQLMNTVRSMMHNPLFETCSPLQALMITDEKPPTHELHLSSMWGMERTWPVQYGPGNLGQENGWKLEYICMRAYPAWSKWYLDENGNLKRGTCDAIKEEALDDADEDFQDHKLSSKKWKADTEMEGSHNKKAKVPSVAAADSLEVAASGGGQSATPSEDTTAMQLNVQ
ncbi:hypothetical protein EDC04DRAFT_2607619 [Pisolithus marmoratus]|nr:hypothetical protein EDC04DRAFT_2607619 [Pisolithus marmoratus]